MKNAKCEMKVRAVNREQVTLTVKGQGHFTTNGHENARNYRRNLA